MKIAHLEIRSFKAIERLEIDFTDALGRVRPVTVMAGPNASGKTSILEALDASLGYAQGLHSTRPGVGMVRRGARRASVSAVLRFSEDEVEAARQVWREAYQDGRTPDVNTREATLRWTYYDPEHKHSAGLAEWTPTSGRLLSQARLCAVRLLIRGSVARSRLDRSGRLYIIDQERGGLRMTIPTDVARLLWRPDEVEDPEARRTEDLKTILVALAIRSRMDPEGTGPSVDYFRQVQDDFARLSPPHRILRVGPTDDGYDIRFRAEGGEYGFDELSSGQRMLLRYIVALRLEHIHRSIVAIDEIELHQHPAWQAGLVRALPGIGDDNQYILTTHSEHVVGLVAPEAVVHLGSLTDAPTPAGVAG